MHLCHLPFLRERHHGAGPASYSDAGRRGHPPHQFIAVWKVCSEYRLLLHRLAWTKAETVFRNKVALRSFITGHKRSGTRMAEPDKKLSLIEEQLVIAKRAVSDGRVRVSTKTEFVTEAAEARLDSENVEVTRVAIGREVSEAPGVRTDGDVTIVPVMEEVLVVEKRLMLVEEIHIRRVATTEDVSIPVELRKQRASIERDDP